MLKYLAPHLPWLHDVDSAGALTSTLSWAGTATATAFLVLFAVINAIGVKFFTYVNSTLTWAKIAIPLIIAGAFVAARFEPSNFVSEGFAPFGVKGVLAAVSSGGIIFSYIGFRHAVDMAGEVSAAAASSFRSRSCPRLRSALSFTADCRLPSWARFSPRGS